MMPLNSRMISSGHVAQTPIVGQSPAPLILLVLALVQGCSGSTAPTPDPTPDPTPAPDSAPVARDWAAQPAIIEIETASELWVLGDIHGDYDRMVALLAKAGLVATPGATTAAEWLGGTAVLVCLGDLVDKWSKGFEVITTLAALQTAATAQGGQVIVLMGNHEATFLANPADGKVADFATELRARGMAPSDVAAGRNPTGQFLRGLPFLARVNQWLFVHAGNTKGATLKDLAVSIEKQVGASGFGAPILSSEDSFLEAVPPWWEEGETAPKTVLERFVTALGVGHIVQGHKPGKIEFSDGTDRPAGSVFQKFGLIYFADVGMSRGIDDSPGTLLHIRGNDVEVFYADGSTGAVR